MTADSDDMLSADRQEGSGVKVKRGALPVALFAIQEAS
jgi:hypothetical protein